jgi:ribosome-associated translation inhibitor RaiA
LVRAGIGAQLAVILSMNRITVVSEDAAINAQARTYAEYRVFAVLARHTRDVRRARVVLRQVDARGTCDKVGCAVTVTLEPTGVLRIRATGPHVYAAINRAVERLGQALGRHLEQRLSS